MSKKHKSHENSPQQMREEDLMNYVASQKSDPFAYGRAKAHMKNGIAGYLPDGGDAFYKATPQKNEHGQIVYTNIQLP